MREKRPAISWKQYPFVRLLPLVIGSILTAQYFRTPDWNVLPPMFLLTLLCTLMSISGRKETALRSVAASGAVMLTVLLACVTGRLHQAVPLTGTKEYSGYAIVTDSPVEKARTWKTTLLLEQEPPYKCLVYLQKNDAAARLQPGDRLQVKIILRPPELPRLPGQFDYRQYLYRKNILATAYLDSDHWSSAGTISRKQLPRRLAEQLRHHLETTIDEHLDDHSAGLIKAMVLGLRSDLGRDLRMDFARAGIMHILAVSGLHVSIVWMIIHTLLAPLIRLRPRLRPPAMAMEVSAIWIFAFVTGFGPAVQRAAFMFSLLALSRLTALKSKAVNLAAASACILLLIRPENLFDAGFRLSYCAVFGILLLYRKFNSLLTFRNPVLRYCWSLQAVSFSAVIGTAPFSIYYFHQFPLVFPVSNLVAVPGAFVLVSGSLLLFMFHSVPFLGTLLATGINTVSGTLIRSTGLLVQPEWCSIQPFYFNGIEVLLAYCLTACLVALVHGRRLSIPLGLSLACVFFFYRGSSHVQAYRATECYPPSVLHTDQASETGLLHVGRKQFWLEYEREALYDPYLRLDGNRKLNRIYDTDTLLLGIDAGVEQLTDYLNRSGQANCGSHRTRGPAPHRE